jgi:glycosyltransferase involved in cell wall biosynthesis
VHVNGYAHARLDSDCPVLAVAHSDVLSWWRAVHGAQAPAEWEAYRDAVVAGLAAADRVVAPSRATIDDLRRNYGLPLRDALVIPNGIDLAAYAPGEKRAVVMASGRLWDEAKNLKLLDAAAEIGWPVEIAGGNVHPERGEIRFDRARVLGQLGSIELAARLAAAAVYAAPAKYEPFGLGILEAAASGCALVLGDIPSLRELWSGAALFVDPGDPADLADALGYLIGNRWQREQLAGAARQRAQSFTGAPMAARYAALYRTLTADAPVVGASFGKAA